MMEVRPGLLRTNKTAKISLIYIGNGLMGWNLLDVTGEKSPTDNNLFAEPDLGVTSLSTSYPDN